MESTLSAPTLSKAGLWTARIIGGLAFLFLLFDAAGKFMRPQPVIDAFARLGMPISQAPIVGAVLLALVILYAVPRLRISAAVLLTGYLGGAVAVQMRAGTTAFETLFPIIIGVMVWAPLYLTDERLRDLIPLRRA